MYSINWKRFLRVIVGFVLLVSVLAVLSDISLFLIQTAISMNLENIDLHQAQVQYASWLSNKKAGTAQDEILNHWTQAWNKGGAPHERIVNIVIDKSQMTVDYSFEITADHPIAEYVQTNSWRDQPKKFVETIFGTIGMSDQAELVNTDFQPASISLDTTRNTITAHIIARKQIEDDETVFLLRYPNNVILLQPERDQVIVNYGDRQLVVVYPYPTLAKDSTLTFDGQSEHELNQVIVQTRLSVTSSPAQNPVINTISRQTVLLRLGGLLNQTPFLSNILGSILAALPLLLFLQLITASPEEKSPVLLFLGEVVIVLLTFHFVYFLIASTASLFGFLMTKIGFVYMLNRWLVESLDSFGIRGYSGFNLLGIFVVQTIIVGVLLPTILVRRSKEWFAFRDGTFSPSKEILLRDHPPAGKVKRFSWLLLFTIIILLLALGIPIAAWNEWSHIAPGYAPDIIAYSFLFLMVFGVIGLLSLATLRGIYGCLDGKPESPAVIATSFWLLFAGNLIWSFAFIAITGLQLFYPHDPYSGWGWFVYSTILGAILVNSFVRLLYALLVQTGWIKKATPLVKYGMLAFAIIMAIPMRLLFANETTAASLYEVLRLTSLLDDLIGPIFLVGLIWYFYEEGNPTRTAGPALKPLTLSVGLIAALIILYPSTANWLYIPLTFLIGYRFLTYFIQPQEHWEKLAPLYKRVFENRNPFLEEIVSINTAERSYQSLHKIWGEKMSSGEKSYAQFKEKIDSLRKELDESNERARVEGQPIKDVALAFGPYETAWQNGIHGTFWAAIFAIPWMLIWLYNFMTGSAVSSAYPLWSFFSDLLNLILSWVGIGFLFGYFYPYLRGKDGLQKGLWLWLVAVLPAVPLALINNTTSVAWQGFLFWSVQIFIHCMLLGLIAFDYMTLRQGYRDWQMLFEVHGIPSVGLSISSILLAIGTAITALFQSRTQEIVKAALSFVIPNADKFINLP